VINVKVTVTKIEIQFPLNNLSLLWPFDTKLGVLMAYIKRQLMIATQVSVIKVKVTVTKNTNSVSDQ
jgi:tetrahydromethanopterin S-methyltransferase subunit C